MSYYIPQTIENFEPIYELNEKTFMKVKDWLFEKKLQQKIKNGKYKVYRTKFELSKEIKINIA